MLSLDKLYGFVRNDPVNAVDPWGESGFPDDFFGWGNPTAFGIPESWEPGIAEETSVLILKIVRVANCTATCSFTSLYGELITPIVVETIKNQVVAAGMDAAKLGEAFTVDTTYGVIKCYVECCEQSQLKIN